MPLPRKVKPGDPIRAADWNNLLDYVRASTPLPGSGVRITRGSGGTTFAVGATRKTSSSSTLQPFELVDATTYNNGKPSYAIRVTKSTLAGDDLTGSSGKSAQYFSDGDTPPFIIQLSSASPGSSGVIVAEVDIDANGDGSIVDNGLSIYNADTTPADDRPGGSYYAQIGSWSIDAVTGVMSINNDRYGPIQIQVCPAYFRSDYIYSLRFL